MRNLIVIISIIVLSVVIAVFQRQKLERMSLQLTRPPGQVSGGQASASKSNTAVPGMPGLSESQRRARVGKTYELLRVSLKSAQQFRSGVASQPSEEMKAQVRQQYKDLSEMFAQLGVDDLKDVIQRIREDETLPDEMRKRAPQICLELMGNARPGVAMELFRTLPDLPDQKKAIASCYYQWVEAEPLQAIQWFEAELRKRDPLTGDPVMLKAYAISIAQTNPTRLFSNEMLNRLTDSPDSVINLGPSIAATLATEKDQAAFLAVLRKQEEKADGNSEVIQQIRKEYVRELSSRLTSWTYEEAIALVNSEFTPEEKAQFAERISHTGDLEEQSRWADWLAGLEWKDTKEHPLKTVVLFWSQRDKDACGSWLESQPPGELKDELAVQYAYQVSNTDPALAGRWAASLPAGKQRDKIVRQVLSAWRTKDPEGAENFAKAQGQ